MIKIEINMNTKKTDQDVMNVMQRDAFYAYLEYCNAINDVPKKEFYDSINNCTDGQVLDKLTSIVERMHGDFERKMQRKAEVKKVGFWSRIFKF